MTIGGQAKRRGRGEEKGQGKRRKGMKKEGAGQGGRGGKGGPAGPPLWAGRALHYGPVGPSTLGRHSGPSILGPSGPSLGPVRPVQYKAHGLAAGLKKIYSGPAR